MISSLILTTLAAPAAALPQADAPTAIAVDRLHVGDGKVLENAVILLQDGRIRSVAQGAAPSGALHVDGAELTPGLVDAYSLMGVGSNTVEESRETTAGMPLLQALRLDHPSFRRAAEQGVTTAFLTPDSLNAFGGLAAVVKTQGGEPADLYAEPGSAAQVLNAAAALKISLGNDVAYRNHAPRRNPSDYFSRRPTTRMGTVWTLRRDFYRAATYAQQRARGEVEADADLDAIAKVLSGELPLRIHARRNNDIQTALRLAEEFQLKQVTMEEATEGHKAAALLAAAGVRVVAGPGYDDLQRSIARGPSIADLRMVLDPPVVCCEDLHDESFLAEMACRDPFCKQVVRGADQPAALYHEAERNEFGMAVDPDDPGPGHDHDQSVVDPATGLVQPKGLALDLLTLFQPRYATGLNIGRRGEGDTSTPALPAILHAAGVHAALGSAEAHDQPLSESSLIHQARLAVRYGLDPQSALSMVTSHAAVSCGMGERVGRVAAGLDADLVLWSGDPLDPASRPLLVLIDGRIAVDNRN